MIKKYSKILFIAFAALLLLQALSSCHKKKKTVYVAEELKEFFHYGVGSYWIFYDSVSNSTDSVFVVQKRTTIPEGTPDRSEETIIINFIDINLENKISTSHWTISLTDIWSVMSIYTESSSSLENHIANFNLTVGIPIGEFKRVYNDTNTYECELYNTYNIFGQNYTNVYIIYNGYEKSHDVIYINKLQGFVSIINTHSYWNKNMHLLRYHIEGS